MEKNLDRETLQQIVLMTGSKKGLGEYLNLDSKELERVWRSYLLKTPAVYAFGLTKDEILFLLSVLKTQTRVANHLGISEATLKEVIKETLPKRLFSESTKEKVEQYIENYKSIKLAVRMMNLHSNWSLDMTESKLRALAEEHEIDLGALLDWSQSAHSNGKGRRAELDFIKWRAGKVLEDKNKTEGSQADYDVLDERFGKVNVKSSRAFKFKAKTRKDRPFYWKFSCGGIEKADRVALMFYDEKMENLLAVKVIEPAAMGEGSSITFNGDEFPQWGTNLPKASLISTDTLEPTPEPAQG